jgi:hypothetical protein
VPADDHLVASCRTVDQLAKPVLRLIEVDRFHGGSLVQPLRIGSMLACMTLAATMIARKLQ